MFGPPTEGGGLMAPLQKPGRSKQDYQTPRPFLGAVEALLGPIAVDLAAHEGNHVCPRWLGPGGEERDAFDARWWKLTPSRLLWLNPPFANIGLWSERCLEEKERGARIALLTPASVGTEWFAQDVAGKAAVLFLRPRLTFEGCEDPYPKDLMLSLFGWVPGFFLWDWTAGVEGLERVG